MFEFYYFTYHLDESSQVQLLTLCYYIVSVTFHQLVGCGLFPPLVKDGWLLFVFESYVRLGVAMQQL
jgi:hypothetical protein